MGDKMFYIKRSTEGLELCGKNGVVFIDSTLKKYINKLCLKKLSTYDGRRQATAKYLKEKCNIPIYINEDIILYPTKSIRCYDTVFVNFKEVLSIKKVSKGYTSFTFTNLFEIELEVSINKILNQHKRIEKLIYYLKDNL